MKKLFNFCLVLFGIFFILWPIYNRCVRQRDDIFINYPIVSNKILLLLIIVILFYFIITMFLIIKLLSNETEIENSITVFFKEITNFYYLILIKTHDFFIKIIPFMGLLIDLLRQIVVHGEKSFNNKIIIFIICYLPRFLIILILFIETSYLKHINYTLKIIPFLLIMPFFKIFWFMLTNFCKVNQKNLIIFFDLLLIKDDLLFNEKKCEKLINVTFNVFDDSVLYKIKFKSNVKNNDENLLILFLSLSQSLYIIEKLKNVYSMHFLYCTLIFNSLLLFLLINIIIIHYNSL